MFVTASSKIFFPMLRENKLGLLTLSTKLHDNDKKRASSNENATTMLAVSCCQDVRQSLPQQKGQGSKSTAQLSLVGRFRRSHGSGQMRKTLCLNVEKIS